MISTAWCAVCGMSYPEPVLEKVETYDKGKSTGNTYLICADCMALLRNEGCKFMLKPEPNQ